MRAVSVCILGEGAWFLGLSAEPRARIVRTPVTSARRQFNTALMQQISSFSLFVLYTPQHFSSRSIK